MIRHHPFTADSAPPGAASRHPETAAVRLMPPHVRGAAGDQPFNPREPAAMTIRRLIPLVALALSACAAPYLTPERAAQVCEERARAAQGPTGSISVGLNSDDGPVAGASIGVTSDFLQGRDPLAVYEECVYQRSGQAPIRPPRLR